MARRYNKRRIPPRSGNIINQTEIAREKRIPPYYSSPLKRVIKSPKIFFIDPALCAYLSGYHNEESLAKSCELGNFFETMVFLHLQVYSELLFPKGKLCFHRSTSGKEVDFIIEWGRKLLAFEVKFTEKPMRKDIKNLIDFIEENPNTLRGILIYNGNLITYLHSKVIAIPWWWL